MRSTLSPASPLRRTKRSTGRPSPRWKEGSHEHVENEDAKGSRCNGTALKPNRQTEPLLTTPPLLEPSHEHPVSTRDRPARTGADVRIEASATNGEVCLALRPYGRASKLRFRSERGRCFEDDSVEQRAARQLPGRPPQHRTRAAKRNAQLGARMPRRTVCRQLSAARKSTSTRKPPASTLLALTAAPIASHRSRTSARPMPVPFTTSLLALAR